MKLAVRPRTCTPGFVRVRVRVRQEVCTYVYVYAKKFDGTVRVREILYAYSTVKVLSNFFAKLE